MASYRLQDLLQTHRFWLLDVVPSSVYPFFVVGSPVYGFSAITAPEITLETQPVKQMNSMWTDHVYSGGSVGSITLSRGVRANDDTFYDWIKRAMRGSDQVLRSMLLVHYTGVGVNVPELPTPIEAWEAAVSLPGRVWFMWKCLDEETEILTENGWCGSRDVKEGDLVYSLNPTTECMELVPVDGYIRRKRTVDESMFSIEGRRMNFRFTDQHGIYAKTTRGGSLVRYEAKDFFEKRGEYLLPISADMGDAVHSGVDLTDDEIRFVAWFCTDGGWKDKKSSCSRLLISQAKAYKDEIRALLTRLKFDFTEYIVPDGRDGVYENAKPLHVFGIPKGSSGRRRGWEKYGEYLKKSISPLLHKMTRKQFEVFWLELVKGNGTFHQDHRGEMRDSQLWCSLRNQADTLAWMATVRGFAVSDYVFSTEFGHEMHGLTMRDEQWIMARPPRMFEHDNPLKKELIQRDEYVWCVSNRNGTIVTRRGGKILILGNCLPVRYKAGSDFDANSGDVSIMELELQPRSVEEIVLLPGSNELGALVGMAAIGNIVKASQR
jgi:hypothetical protein